MPRSIVVGIHLFSNLSNVIHRIIFNWCCQVPISIMPRMVNWTRRLTLSAAAGCAAVVALVASLNQPDVFNPMTMDAQLAGS